jgi:glycosyltransferase involved in cell wall biosynthesis
MTKISAVIITFNEGPSIERTLASLVFCDEIVVVDSGSLDDTVSICKKKGCKIHFRKFDGYGPQKRFAVELAVNDWVLALDADEVVTPELRKELLALFSGTNPEVQGFYLPISLVFLGRVIRFGGEFKKPHLRLFNKKLGNFNDNAVHEGVNLSGATAVCKNHIVHYSYRSIHHYFEKFNAYTTASAQTLFEKNRNAAVFHTVVRFPLTFIKIYLIKGCVLDGFAGFVWSLLSSMYPVVKFIKLYELLQRDKETPRRSVPKEL